MTDPNQSSSPGTDATDDERDGRLAFDARGGTRTRRWRGALFGGLLIAVIGLTLGRTDVLALAVVVASIGFIAASASSPSGNLRVERRIADESLDPGVPTEVTVTVHNEGNTIAADVRVIDTVPPDVEVTRNPPAFATTLAPNESDSISYEIVAPRGRFDFGSVLVRRGNTAASATTLGEVTPAGRKDVACETMIDSLPLHRNAINFVGQTPTNKGGSGVEFQSIREYQPGDPISRIDWNRYARSGELATVQYREERSTTVVLLIDNLSSGAVDHPSGINAFEYVCYAASKGVAACVEAGNRTGVGLVIGNDIEPTTDIGLQHETAVLLSEASVVKQRLTADGGHTPTKETNEKVEKEQNTDRGTEASITSPPLRSQTRQRLSELRGLVPAEAQFVVISSVTHDGIVSVTDYLLRHGYATSVLSPNPATSIGETEPTVGARFAGVERQRRLQALRDAGARIGDWDVSEPIGVELERIRTRW